ncbi:hypothetical protein RJ640_021019 [Escallonia rubra]|uniref:UBC core domain-containing protein n=2 Tax=Escallonia TaxID=23075 RepID=A0AA88UWM2_9ASTE|nr:hypothetical protein RJ640_021019 [Escallonia rubra]
MKVQNYVSDEVNIAKFAVNFTISFFFGVMGDKCLNLRASLVPGLFRTDVKGRLSMIKLFKVKEKQRELAENSNGKPPVKKQSAGELRLHRDISELNLPKTCSISFPNGKDDLMNFEVTIRPDEGYYNGGIFVFTFQISPIYPHEAPKVKCKTKVYHPNIDLEGNVCLNILREDWKPVLNINTIIYGLYHLFTEPNHEDPLNPDAAGVLRDNPKLFESNVRRAMAGGYVGQTFFTRCI